MDHNTWRISLISLFPEIQAAHPTLRDFAFHLFSHPYFRQAYTDEPFGLAPVSSKEIALVLSTYLSTFEEPQHSVLTNILSALFCKVFGVTLVSGILNVRSL